MKTLKEVSIVLPDGVEVRMGMNIYTTRSKRASYESDVRRYPENYILEHSGKSRYAVVKHKVINVNQAANIRSFTVRSTKGCESTYSVKNSCLPADMFGKLSSVVRFTKDKDSMDADKARVRIEGIEESIQNYKEDIKKERLLIKNLK